MKTQEPIPVMAIPPNDSRYRAIYEQVLQLNGLALPVEFESKKEAISFAQTSQSKGAGHRLGLMTVRRGKTVFIYRK